MPRPAPKVAIKITHNGRRYTARTRLKPHTPQRRRAFSQRLIDECRSLERGGTRRCMSEFRRLQKLKCSIMTKWQMYLGKQVARGRLLASLHPFLSRYDQVLRNSRNTDPYSVELMGSCLSQVMLLEERFGCFKAVHEKINAKEDKIRRLMITLIPHYRL